LGEFHIAVLAENCNAVKELRKRKKRKAKPFAVMFPNLRQLEDYVEISENKKISYILYSTHSNFAPKRGKKFMPRD
jgi:hydrogenase maturation factor HypF (carbamoyltransferase family)